jgi:hypothetical protein
MTKKSLKAKVAGKKHLQDNNNATATYMGNDHDEFEASLSGG